MVANADTKKGLVSFVCGLGGLLLFWVPVIGLILSILGIIFYTRQNKIKQTGFATAGLVLGILGALAGVVALIAVMIMLWGTPVSQGITQVM